MLREFLQRIRKCQLECTFDHVGTHSCSFSGNLMPTGQWKHEYPFDISTFGAEKHSLEIPWPTQPCSSPCSQSVLLRAQTRSWSILDSCCSVLANWELYAGWTYEFNKYRDEFPKPWARAPTWNRTNLNYYRPNPDWPVVYGKHEVINHFSYAQNTLAHMKLENNTDRKEIHSVRLSNSARLAKKGAGKARDWWEQGWQRVGQRNGWWGGWGRGRREIWIRPIMMVPFKLLTPNGSFRRNCLWSKHWHEDV